MNGQKTGGRTAGTPNKRTVELMDRLEELNCDPLEGLAKIAGDPATDVALRARVLADLLPYIYPKRKALEVTGMDGGPVEVDLADARAALCAKLGFAFPSGDET